MGILNCTKSLRIEDEMILEANFIKLTHNKSTERQNTIYQKLFDRISISKEDFLNLFKKNPSYNVRNYDPYYGLLITHIISNQSTMSLSESTEEIKVITPDLILKPKATAFTSSAFSKLSNFSPVSTFNSTRVLASLPKQLKKKQTMTTNTSISKITQRSFAIITNDEYKTKLDIISLLPYHVINLLFSFIANQYSSCLKVSIPWYVSLQSSLDKLFHPLTRKLLLSYSQYVQLCSSCTTFTKQSQGSDRIDRVFRLKLLNNSAGKTLTMGYKYRFVNERNKYMTIYKIDCKKQDKQVIWVHVIQKGKQMTLNNVGSIAICTGDDFEIAINYYTLRGLIDVSTIVWIPPVVEAISESNVKDLGKIKLMQGRVCELEQLSNGEWYDSKYYDKITINLTELETLFHIISMEYSLIDPRVKKVTLSAFRAGKNK